jgi:hypothetical protein
VNLVPDKFVCTTQKFRSDQDDRGGSISDFLVLLSGQRYEDSSLEVKYGVSIRREYAWDMSLQQGVQPQAARELWRRRL